MCEMLDLFSSETPGSGEPGYFEKTSFVQGSNPSRKVAMDIMGPPPEEQVAPAPWLAARRNVDVFGLVDRILQEDPEASLQKVLSTLASWNVQANGVLVAQQILDFRQQGQAGSSLVSPEKKASLREGRSVAPVGAA
jgi:hypothetical protein